MIRNIINEAIIAIASLATIVGVLEVQKDVEDFVTTSAGAVLLVVATVVLFLASGALVPLAIVAVSLSIGSVRLRKKGMAPVDRLLQIYLIATWAVMALRFASQGFSATINNVGILIIAGVVSIYSSYHRKNKRQKKQEEDEQEQGLLAAFTEYARANPAKTYLAGVATVAVLVFIVAVTRAI